MSLTGNYEAAFELREEVVRDVFLAAHENGEIPLELSSTQSIGGYNTTAVANVLQTGIAGTLGVSFDTTVHNGIEMTLPLDVQVQIENPPAPSISPINFQCLLEITAPVQDVSSATEGQEELVLNVAGLPAGQVVVNMPDDPVVEITEELVEDGLHKAYDDGLIPHQYNYAGILVDILDDDTVEAHQIQFTLDDPVTYVAEGSGTVTIPMVIHFLGDHDATATIRNVKLALVNDELHIKFGGIQLEDVTLSFENDNARELIHTMVKAYGTRTVFVPRNETIANIISSEARARLDSWGEDGNGRVHLYTPNAVENLPIEIREFDVSVKPGFLAVLFNPMSGGGRPDEIENFIPSDKRFAQALAEPVVQDMFDEAVDVHILEENDDTNFPMTFKEKIKGHEVTLTSRPDFVLHSGYIKMDGSASVAIDCWFDPDIDYEAKIDFSFDTNDDGEKIIKPNVYDEDMDLSCLDWFLGFLFILYGWIALIIVNSVIESVGGKVVSNQGDDIADGTEYLAGEIHGVGEVTTELDQIDIRTDGIVLSGGVFTIVAKNALMYVPSDSSSPYKSSVSSAFLLASPYPGASQYVWMIPNRGDKYGKQVSEQFSKSGTYPFELHSKKNGPRGVDTRHFGRIRIDSVPPTVNAGQDITVDEGDIVEFSGAFTNPEYTDTHKASWGWGDASSEPGQITQTNDSPQAEGVVRGKHAYGTNGDYTVRLRVIDEDGCMGVDTRNVEVLNVPPTVIMPKSMFAYPGIPVTFVAGFTDPGWLDTHVGRWLFGDNSAPIPAVIKEVNVAPIGYGIAAASNVYENLGTYLARCTVVDNDGGVGAGTMPVHVIELKNRNFEKGFRLLRQGQVANEWEPCGSAASAGDSEALRASMSNAVSNGQFKAEEFVVHQGQRSQNIIVRGGGRAGIYQSLGSNEGWDYQVTGWHHIAETTEGLCRIGINPDGGTDPTAEQVVWCEGRRKHHWEKLAVRAAATGRKITIFLETISTADGVSAFFDEIEVIPYPCELPDPVPPLIEEPEEKPRKLCVDWSNATESHELPPSFKKQGFSFLSNEGAPFRVLLWGRSDRVGKLEISRSGFQVVLPFTASKVSALIDHYKLEMVQITAHDANGEELGQFVSRGRENENAVAAIEAEGIHSVWMVSEGGSQAMLRRLCAYMKSGGLQQVVPGIVAEVAVLERHPEAADLQIYTHKPTTLTIRPNE